MATVQAELRYLASNKRIVSQVGYLAKTGREFGAEVPGSCLDMQEPIKHKNGTIR